MDGVRIEAVATAKARLEQEDVVTLGRLPSGMRPSCTMHVDVRSISASEATPLGRL